MRFAYADPPYIGQAKSRYADDPQCAEVNHELLIEWLNRDFDGWALSLSSPTLKQILPFCPDEVRVGAWVKPWGRFVPNVNPAYVWEPVIFCGGRKRERSDDTVRDWVSANATMKKGLCGVKPYEFCCWIFQLLGMQPEDEFTDVFPGSGAVFRSWEIYRIRMLGVPQQIPFELSSLAPEAA